MSANTPIVGLNIRAESTSQSPKLGLLPRGARIELGERSANGKWGKIARIISGEIKPVRPGEQVDPRAVNGWVFIPELEPDIAEPEAFDSVVVLAQPRSIEAGALIGYLGTYQRYEDAAALPRRDTRPLLHLEVFSGDDVPAFVARSRRYADTLPASARSLLVVERDARLVQPTEPDVTLPSGQEIRAMSEVSGRWVQVRKGTLQVVPRSSLGAFDSSTNTYSNGEIWTGWYVGATDDVRTRDEAEARRLGHARREVLVPTDPPVWVERGAVNEAGQRARIDKQLHAWSAFPLQVADPVGPEMPVSLVRSRPELDRLDADKRAVDSEGKKWWYVEVRAPGRPPARGWVREAGQSNVFWQSPWAWPGFDFVEEREVAPIDLRSRWLLKWGDSLAREEPDFKMRAEKSEASALLAKIYELIDENGDGRLDPQELRATARQPVLGRRLARVIALYESEWGGAMEKWDELDPLMLDGLPEWRIEKRRINALRWWPAASGRLDGFPSDPMVHHIHPIALVANFLGHGLPLEEARVRAFLRMIRVGEGTEGPLGYERLFGGQSFIRHYGRTFDDHPRIKISRGGYNSTAAGAYQVMRYTWDDPSQISLRRRYGISDFTPRSQDRYGVVILKHKRRALDDVEQGRIREAITRCNREWTSLPGSPDGQPTVSWDRALRKFDEYLAQEQRGESDLAIGPGDLDDIL